MFPKSPMVPSISLYLEWASHEHYLTIIEQSEFLSSIKYTQGKENWLWRIEMFYLDLVLMWFSFDILSYREQFVFLWFNRK